MKRVIFLSLAVVTAAAIIFGITACASRKDSGLADPPLITSATYQHTLYNGRGQAIDARAAKEDAPLAVTYYTSEADYDADINGFTEAPTEVGLYYARIRRPAGGGYREGRDIKVEYRIQKALPPPEEKR
ncbi:MAG: hypothetical protein LBP27_04720 [Treponema sp.]|nr:hypothetical protein [Treponema sp.]